MLGCSYLHPSSKVVANNTRMYWLNTSRMVFDNRLLKKLDKLYRSNAEVEKLLKCQIKYRNADSTSTAIPLAQIKAFPDLTNGTGNWYGSPSRLDALYKIIENSEVALDAKNINLTFSQQFLVGGDANADRTDLHGNLTDSEKKSIEDMVLSGKNVTGVKSMVDIKRYVSDMGKLKLDEAYNESFNRMASMFGIPKELWDSIKEGSTFENQEKAIGRHVSYSVQAKADDLANGCEEIFGYDTDSKDIRLTYDHLPSMQVFEQEKAERNQTNIQTVQTLVQLGADINVVAPDYGFDYNFVKPKPVPPTEPETIEDDE